ncbi:hypothetical protein, partial [Oleiphilus sp. HI0066]|uniref:hypothetical protein n=5 Tax=Oleiphilus TaxID=141450 RepID=UPI000AED71B8
NGNLENERTLYTPNSYENLATPLWKDANTILLTRKPPSQPWQLVEYSLNGQSLNIVLSEANTNIFEIYAGPTSQNVILSSDKNGFIELWSYHLEQQSLNPLTISIGGASSGSYSAQTGQLAYRYYSDKGWDIVSTDYKELSPVINAEKSAERNAEKTAESNPENNAMPGTVQSPHSYKGLELDTSSHQDREHKPLLQHDYNPLESIAPQSWFFGFTSDNTNTTASIILNGRDVLNFHNWGLIAGRDFDNDLNVFSGAYTLYNHLTALYSRAYDYTEGSASGPPAFVDKARLIEDQEDSALLAHKTWRFDFSQLTLTGGVNNYQRTLEDQFTNTQQSIH